MEPSSIPELKAELARLGVAFGDCVEKRELLEKLRLARPAPQVAPPRSVRELQQELERFGVSAAGCAEKADLVERLAACHARSASAGVLSQRCGERCGPPKALHRGVLLAALKGALAIQDTEVSYVDLQRDSVARPLALEDAAACRPSSGQAQQLALQDAAARQPTGGKAPLALTDTTYEQARSEAYRKATSAGAVCTVLALPTTQRVGSDACTTLLAYRHGPVEPLPPSPSLPELRAAYRRHRLFDRLDLDVGAFDEFWDFNFAASPFINEGFTDAPHVRGGLPYRRPLGWQRFGLAVLRCFEDRDWLAADGRAGEWAVAYHGTCWHAVRAIARSGLRTGGSGGVERAHGAMFGEGVYCAPHVEHAAFFAEAAPVVTDEGLGHFQVVFQCRVRPGGFAVHNDGLGDVFVVASEADIRPYAMLLSECTEDGTALLSCRDWP